LPFISQRPETTVKDQLAVDAKDILDTKAGNAMKVLNTKTGQYEADYHAIHNDDGSLTPWFKQFATESFDGYFNGLGRGDKRKALREYLMDSVDVADRKVLMDQLAGGDAESYGINSLNRLLEGKNSTDINNFINSYVKTNWLDQSKNAVLEANKQMINATNADAYKANLELQKDEANTRKSIYQAEKSRVDLQKAKREGMPKGNSAELTDIYNSILNTNVELQLGEGTFDGTLDDLSDTLENIGEQQKRNVIERIKPALTKYNIFLDQDEDGNYLLGRAGMKDPKKKRPIDPSRIDNLDFLMKEIAALSGTEWNKPIIYK